MIHFVLGGARSGKSRFAEQLTLNIAQQQKLQPVYIATATVLDDEMALRIAKHQQDRDEQWQLIECPLTLSEKLTQLAPNSIYLVDCLTLWLNNQLYNIEQTCNGYKQKQQQLQLAVDNLLFALASAEANIVLVSNEVGFGIVPLGETSRLFADYCGWLNQGVAALAQQVTLVTAGIPLKIKHED